MTMQTTRRGFFYDMFKGGRYTTGWVTYQVPFGEKKICYSPKTFSGKKHLISARIARPFEITAYRNLAVNVNDQHQDANCYPHASANIETRDESVFIARNTIDGMIAGGQV